MRDEDPIITVIVWVLACFTVGYCVTQMAACDMAGKAPYVEKR